MSLRDDVRRMLTILSCVENREELHKVYQECCKKAGVAKTISTIYDIFGLEQSVRLFEATGFPENERKIRTIATFSTRAYGGGIECVQAQLARTWAEMGYNVVLITEEEPNSFDYDYPNSIKRIVIPPMDRITEHLNALELCLRQEDVDVFINNNWESDKVLWQCACVRACNVYYLLYTHGNFAYDYSYNPYFLLSYRVFRLANAVLALSETFAIFYRSVGCKCLSIRNPIPENLKSIVPDYKVATEHILSLGRISYEKNPLDIIKAFSIIHQNNASVVLDVVGDGNPRIMKEMKKKCSEEGIDDFVIFHGMVEPHETTSFYLNSDVLIYASATEGFPMTLLEAEACALPIVMYDLPYLTIVKNSESIKTVKQGDYRALAEQTLKLLTDSQNVEKRKAEARKDFEVFLKYDYVRQWNDIFDFLELNEKTSDGDEQESEEIIPMLLDAINEGKKNQEKKWDYKLAKSLLLIPRTIKKILCSK